MKYKYLMYLLLAVLLGACSDDEPKSPASEHPSEAEVVLAVNGKTWMCKDYTLVDSKGRVLDKEQFFITGTLMEPFAMEFQDNGVIIADPGVMFISHPSRYITKFSYDETTGQMVIYNSREEDEVGHSFFIESAGDDELVARAHYGILPKDYYDYVVNGASDIVSEARDEKSYVRLVYMPLGVEDAKAFWEKYPERNK